MPIEVATAYVFLAPPAGYVYDKRGLPDQRRDRDAESNGVGVRSPRDHKDMGLS